jgi:hypothetical protein
LGFRTKAFVSVRAVCYLCTRMSVRVCVRVYVCAYMSACV